MANVTMRDIAEKLGVSIVSVSKALTGKEGVSEGDTVVISSDMDLMEGLQVNPVMQ